jgi:predicted negative regulator of RcsB-dependent stress response
MKKILPIIIVILLIVIVWFSWKTVSKKEVVQETPEQVLDKATQSDKTDEIEIKLDGVDVDTNSSADFDSVDGDIKGI